MKWSSAKPTRKRIWSGLVQTEDHFTCLVWGLKYVSWADNDSAFWHTSNHTDMSSYWWKPLNHCLLLSNPWGPRGNHGLNWANPYRQGVDESRTTDLLAKPTSFADIGFGFGLPCTGHQKLLKMGQHSIISSFCAQRAKKALAEGAKSRPA